MKKLFKKITNWSKTQLRKIKPGKNAHKGAAFALLSIAIILWVVYSIFTSINIKDNIYVAVLFVALFITTVELFITTVIGSCSLAQASSG